LQLNKSLKILENKKFKPFPFVSLFFLLFKGFEVFFAVFGMIVANLELQRMNIKRE